MGPARVLPRIQQPADLRGLSDAELDRLAEEIREHLVRTVTATGGHLGPNLGVVELTLALHRVFDSPRDRLVFDTGHQSYVHKLVTGRQDFSLLRREGGVSGYPSRAESEHDVVENSHASTALSWADGIARAFQAQGVTDRHAVAVVGDGALTGGMAWEALNNIAHDPDRPVVVVVNDNGRSYAPTIGGLATHLAGLRTDRRYERLLDWGRSSLVRRGRFGRFLFGALHAAKAAIKDFVAPQGLFSDLGIKYVGPVDGHDRPAVERALDRARRFGGPVLVHVITQKGRGYDLAEADDADHFHGIGAIDPVTGASLSPAAPSWTSVFADEMVAVGRQRPDVFAITAAMLIPVGLQRFAQAHPDRVADVGIAEQHGATAAAGMALAGLHPVMAVYATFLNRAFDQVLMDVALHRAGVTFVLDRAGATGDDGASHNGMWDMSILQVVPGLRLAAPRDGATLRAELREALDVDHAPTVVRFPKGALVDDVPAVAREGATDVLRAPHGDRPDVLLVSVGAMAGVSLEAAERLAAHGVDCTVVDPRWVKPVDRSLVDLARRHRVVAVVEDGGRTGGVAAAVRQALAEADVRRHVEGFGLAQEFPDHMSRSALLERCGLTGQAVARRLAEVVSRESADGTTPVSEPSGEDAGRL
ncbi:1-deoxy-D-xylulose-5-phosphate synthase [Aquipuribacter nitratireducens]|uniref:1-deoxy-D-xylulose-5-phosphate synthase n=1 Tax=Aquipuribacter nitratireducens TaxID=650104 RepID=A0ABW0GT44_9MICO